MMHNAQFIIHYAQFIIHIDLLVNGVHICFIG